MSWYVSVVIIGTINLIVLNVFRDYISEAIIWVNNDIEEKSTSLVFLIICFASIIPLINATVLVCLLYLVNFKNCK